MTPISLVVNSWQSHRETAHHVAEDVADGEDDDGRWQHQAEHAYELHGGDVGGDQAGDEHSGDEDEPLGVVCGRDGCALLFRGHM